MNSTTVFILLVQGGLLVTINSNHRLTDEETEALQRQGTSWLRNQFQELKTPTLSKCRYYQSQLHAAGA